jgi:hypothetical protein
VCVCVCGVCVWCVCVSRQPDFLMSRSLQKYISCFGAGRSQSVPCYSATRIRSHRHFCPVNKYKNSYCVFVKKLNIFTYDIHCSRDRGVILRPSCPFRQLPFCEHRTWTHFRRLLKQMSEVRPVTFFWLSRLCWRKNLVFREAGVLVVSVLSGETVRPSTPHYFIWVCSLGAVCLCKGVCLCVCLLAFHGHM